MEDLSRTSGSWLDQHVSLVHLRPLVLNSLKVSSLEKTVVLKAIFCLLQELSVNTEVLSEPHKMPQEALNSVTSISTALTTKLETDHRDGQ